MKDLKKTLEEAFDNFEAEYLGKLKDFDYKTFDFKKYTSEVEKYFKDLKDFDLSDTFRKYLKKSDK